MIKNSLKTAFLLATLSGLLFFLGSFLGGASGALVALVFSLIMNFGIYFYSDKLVLRMYGAQPLDMQQYPVVYATVKELSALMNMPAPQLWLVSLPVPNAFATGRSPAYASIAFTREIITLLDQKELRGVIAHELSHIKNRDILIGTVAATVATAIGYIVQMIQHRLFWSSFSPNYLLYLTLYFFEQNRLFLLSLFHYFAPKSCLSLLSLSCNFHLQYQKYPLI